MSGFNRGQARSGATQALVFPDEWFFERFYEKVIKVKADVAALLNLFSDVSIDVRW